MADGDDVLWGRSFITHDFNSSMYTNGGKIDAEIGYGFNLWDGASVFTPYGGVALTDNEDDEVRLGSKLNIGSDIQFELKSSRTYQGDGATENEINLESDIKWKGESMLPSRSETDCVVRYLRSKIQSIVSQCT